MKNKVKRNYWSKILVDVLCYVMQAIILYYLLIVIMHGPYKYLVGGLIAFVLTFLPLIIQNKWKIEIPEILRFLVVFSMFLYVGGHVKRWFITLYPFYDKFAHFVTSTAVGLIAFLMIYVFFFSRKLELKKSILVAFIIFFTLAVGSLWEIGEFAIDQTFGTQSQHTLEETMLDMVFNLLGAIFVFFFAVSKYGEGFARNFYEKLPKRYRKF